MSTFFLTFVGYVLFDGSGNTLELDPNSVDSLVNMTYNT
jgi:hypothetical protein